jgi:NADH-quinone oxidoreductase subunit M
MITFPWITTLTMVPVVGAIVLLALGGRNKVLVRWIALAFSLVALILTLVLWHKFNTVADGFQFQELHTWIPSLNAEYRVGIDGLGLLMLLLTSIVVPIGMLGYPSISHSSSCYSLASLALLRP